MDFRVWLQLYEAFGHVNRWFCSQAYGRPIDDKELLLSYYVKSGGSADFARRYRQATSGENRWYCSEFYRRDVRDPEILWDYYMNYAPVRAAGKTPRIESRDMRAEMNVAC